MYGLHKFPIKNTSILANSNLLMGNFTPFFHTFFKKNVHRIVRLLKRYMNISNLHRFSIENSSILAISHLFWRFHIFFHTFFKNLFHHIIRLLRHYKDIYDLHRFLLKILLYKRFHTFFSDFTPFFNLFQFFFPPYSTPTLALEEYI